MSLVLSSEISVNINIRVIAMEGMDVTMVKMFAREEKQMLR